MDNNFENVKVGDQVVVHHYGWYIEDKLEKVTKVTPKRFVVGGYYFNKTNGTAVGESYSYCYIPTDEEASKVKRDCKIKSLMTIIMTEFSSPKIVQKMSEEELDLVYEIIKKHNYLYLILSILVFANKRR